MTIIHRCTLPVRQNGHELTSDDIHPAATFGLRLGIRGANFRHCSSEFIRLRLCRDFTLKGPSVHFALTIPTGWSTDVLGEKEDIIAFVCFSGRNVEVQCPFKDPEAVKGVISCVETFITYIDNNLEQIQTNKREQNFLALMRLSKFQHEPSRRL